MIRPKTLLAALALALPLCTAASEPLGDDELDELLSRPSIALYKAYAEFKMADYASARRIWRALAERGVAEAQFALSVMLHTGAGMAQDEEAARMWLMRAARAGHPEAVEALAERP